MNNKGFVYVIQAIRTNRIKIGHSVDPEKRLLQLQTGSPYELELLAAWPGTVEAEQRAHQALERYRRVGEWFEVTMNEVIPVIKACLQPAAKRPHRRIYQSPRQVTIFDAPNVCREIMAKCQSLAERADPELADEIRAIGDDAKRMLDAIVASVDQILAAQV